MASQNLIIASSDSESAADDDLENIPKKKRGKALEWIESCTFPNAESALSAIKTENLWWKVTDNKAEDGRKVIYICKVSRQCGSKIMLPYHSQNHSVTLHRLEIPHYHENKNRKNGLSTELKEAVQSLYISGVTKPKLILRNLADKGFIQPKLKQLNNFLSSLRREIHGPPIVSLGQLRTLCQQRSTSEGLDEPFILNYSIESDEEDPSRRSFRIFMTTNRLLTLLDQKGALHVDGTYKLIWQGFPVLVTGISDMDKKFHPVGMAVVTSENEEDFRYVFQILRDVPGDNLFKPEVLVADCADAITNASEYVFGPDTKRVHCWAHVVRNIDKKLTLVPDDFRSEVRYDILALQLCKSEMEFDVAKALWVKKWDIDGMGSFNSYFIGEYLTKYDGWYEGKAQNSPSTNNCLESTNNVIKSDGTLRNRLQLGEFIDTAMNLIKQWSIERDPAAVNSKMFSIRPTITLKLMTEAYTWLKLLKENPGKVKFRKRDTVTHYFISPGGSTGLKEADITRYTNYVRKTNWRTFDTFKKYQTSLWLVSIGDLDWENGTCTCPIFLKSYVCKHLIGIAISQKLFDVPDAAKTNPIGQKRKRGRPPLAKKALLTQ